VSRHRLVIEIELPPDTLEMALDARAHRAATAAVEAMFVPRAVGVGSWSEGVVYRDRASVDAGEPAIAEWMVE